MARMILAEGGTLYEGNKEIGKTGRSTIYLSSSIPNRCKKDIFNLNDNNSFISFTIKLSRLDSLSLQYGFRVTNNWLKMHGGIMTRKGKGKKKR